MSDNAAPLSEGELFDLLRTCTEVAPVRLPPGWIAFARAIERAHGVTSDKEAGVKRIQAPLPPLDDGFEEWWAQNWTTRVPAPRAFAGSVWIAANRYARYKARQATAQGIDSGTAGETRSGSTPKGQEPDREAVRPTDVAKDEQGQTK
jgi:hypothetical protein